ncbi:hypothetical protein [Achromobacter sp. UMC46]|uniref:hypothetical protein n=1 Tax=Achromobacter sp. UMC46 TaxID=1862319 RepID=UPI0015FFC904|nr:hypothetical protein [Achromobacter sp. UMC46]MBB1593604.1 hypothetical protein [Achromobacter sp. UMC46]
MAITALPNPPSRSDPANFPERADAFMAALPVFAQEANLLQGQINDAAQAAGENSAAAEGSAQDAANSRSQAGQKAAEAVAAADGAAQKALEAASSAALAAEWATKTGAPVEGGEFSAKHFAQLAAQGMGLPVFSPTNIPNADVGPIFVPNQGGMEWRNGRYVVQRADHGQCRLIYISPTELCLIPFGGDGLVINGRQYRIPAAGTSITTASTTAATVYYFYAKSDSAGGVVVEPRIAATNPHSRHSDGVEILTGNPDYTLVGWASTTSTNTFMYTTTDRRVMSWFNRRQRHAREIGGPSTTLSNSSVQLTSGVIISCWAGEEINFAATGEVHTTSSTLSTGIYLSVRVGAAALEYGNWGYSVEPNGTQRASSVVDTFVAPSDGTHALAPYGFTNTASAPAVFRQTLVATAMI